MSKPISTRTDMRTRRPANAADPSTAAKSSKTEAPSGNKTQIDFSRVHNKKKTSDTAPGLRRSISAPLLGAQRLPLVPLPPRTKGRYMMPENHKAVRELPAPTVVAERAGKNFLSSVTGLLKKKEPADSPYNLLPAPLREGISKTNAARLVDVVLKDPANRTKDEKKFLAKHQQLVDQFECAGTFGARTRNLRSYLEGARIVHAKEIPKDQLVGNRAAELRLSIPAVFRSNISNTKDDLAFVSAVQYSPVKEWRDEDWGQIKHKAQAYEDTGRSLSDYMAGAKAELDKLKAG